MRRWRDVWTDVFFHHRHIWDIWGSHHQDPNPSFSPFFSWFCFILSFSCNFSAIKLHFPSWGQPNGNLCLSWKGKEKVRWASGEERMVALRKQLPSVLSPHYTHPPYGVATDMLLSFMVQSSVPQPANSGLNGKFAFERPLPIKCFFSPSCRKEIKMVDYKIYGTAPPYQCLPHLPLWCCEYSTLKVLLPC